MKLGKLKLDKNAWIAIGGAASAIAAVTLLAQGRKSSAPAADPYGLAGSADPSAFGPAAAVSDHSAAFLAAISDLSGQIATDARTTHDEIQQLVAASAAGAPPVIDRRGAPERSADLPPATTHQVAVSASGQRFTDIGQGELIAFNDHANARIYGGPQGVVTASTPNPNPGKPFFIDAASSDAYARAHPSDYAAYDRAEARHGSDFA